VSAPFPRRGGAIARLELSSNRDGPEVPLSSSSVIARTAGLVGLVSVLGAGACGSVEDVSADSGMQSSRDAAGANDGGDPTSAVSFRADQSAAQLKSWLLWKVASDEEPDEYAFGIDVASNVAGTIVAFSGADPANPIDSASGQRNGNSDKFTTPPLTTTSNGDLAVWFGAQLWPVSGCTSGQIAPPDGFTRIAEECLSAQSTGVLLAAATLALGDAGMQPDWEGSSPYAETNTAQAVALRPAE
jgi:hypothetical protein